MAIVDSIRMNLLWHRPKPAGILAKERENGAAGASLLVQGGAKLRWVSTIPHFSLRYFFGSWIQTLFKHQVWSDQQLNIWSTALECFGDQKRHVHIYTGSPRVRSFLDFVWTSQKCRRSVSFDHFWDSNKSLDMSRDNMWLPVSGVRPSANSPRLRNSLAPRQPEGLEGAGKGPKSQPKSRWFLSALVVSDCNLPPGPNFFQQTVASNICMPGAIWFMAMHMISFCMGYSQIAQLYM